VTERQQELNRGNAPQGTAGTPAGGFPRETQSCDIPKRLFFMIIAGTVSSTIHPKHLSQDRMIAMGWLESVGFRQSFSKIN